jgi:cell division protein FtsW (lipid II flippase)
MVGSAVRHDSKLSRQRPPPETPRELISTFVVIVATVVAFVGFARVSLGWTLAISTLVLIALLYFLYSVGIRKERERRTRNKRI